MIRYPLDTNVVSEPVRQRPDPRVVRRILQESGRTALASVVWSELLYGLARLPPGRRRDELARYLGELDRVSLVVLPFDRPAAEWLARERARLDALGQPRPLIDGQIAAIAATRGLTLVTRNVSDFHGFDGLRVENWFADAPSEERSAAHP